MKICVLINGFGQGGAQRQCIHLLNYLQDRGDVTVLLFYFFEGEYFDLLNKKGIVLKKIPYFSFYDPYNVFRISRLISIHKPDIVFSWFRSADIYAAVLRCFHPGLVWIMAERNSRYPPTLLFRMRRLAGRLAHHIVCNSESGKRFWVAHGAQEKSISVIPNALSVPVRHLPHKESYNTTGRISIGYAGRLEPQKNIENTTIGLCQVAKNNKEVEVYIIGSGSLDAEVKAIVAESGLSSVHVLPFQKEIFDYYQMLDVFVSLSHHEGMPNAVMENAALGNKVVVSKIPEHIEMLGSSYQYYVSDIDNVQQIAETIEATAFSKEPPDFSYFNAFFSSCSAQAVGERYLHCFKQVLAEYEGG